MVFYTRETVTLGASSDGRPFRASVLAPFAEVVVEDNAGYIDGFVVARKFTMNAGGGSVELHGRCFDGDLTGITCGPKVCAAVNPSTGPDPTFVDNKKTRKCLKLQTKGKCTKRKVRTVKCRATCGDCDR